MRLNHLESMFLWTSGPPDPTRDQYPARSGDLAGTEKGRETL